MSDETKAERVKRSGTAQFHFQAHGVEILIIDEVVMINGRPCESKDLVSLEHAVNIARQTILCANYLSIEVPEETNDE
jgi:hypothetical protein